MYLGRFPEHCLRRNHSFLLCLEILLYKEMLLCVYICALAHIYDNFAFINGNNWQNWKRVFLISLILLPWNSYGRNSLSKKFQLYFKILIFLWICEIWGNFLKTRYFANNCLIRVRIWIFLPMHQSICMLTQEAEAQIGECCNLPTGIISYSSNPP